MLSCYLMPRFQKESFQDSTWHTSMCHPSQISLQFLLDELPEVESSSPLGMRMPSHAQGDVVWGWVPGSEQGHHCRARRENPQQLDCRVGGFGPLSSCSVERCTLLCFHLLVSDIRAGGLTP